eukprot:gene4074-7363_t
MSLTKIEKPTKSVRVMSFNILSDLHKKNFNWEKRKSSVVELISHHAPEIFGLQDCSTKQLNELDELLTKKGEKYNKVAQSAYFDSKKQQPVGENCPIFYNTDAFELIESGTFWLSEDTEEVGSKSWDAISSRISTWAKFFDKSKTKEEDSTEGQFLVYNTHWDQGRETRRNGSYILRNAIESKMEEDEIPTVIVLGDFNCTMESNDLSILSKKHDGVFFEVMPDVEDSEEDSEQEEAFELHFAQKLCVNEDSIKSTENSFIGQEKKATTDFIFIL